MASEQETQNTTDTSNESVLSILAMLAGLGIVMMVFAVGIGVVLENADNDLIGLFAMAGAGLLVAGVVGWVIVVRPHENFDDISEAKYHGHDHDDHDDDSHAGH